jgi:hypothetical protein
MRAIIYIAIGFMLGGIASAALSTFAQEVTYVYLYSEFKDETCSFNPSSSTTRCVKSSPTYTSYFTDGLDIYSLQINKNRYDKMSSKDGFNYNPSSFDLISSF